MLEVKTSLSSIWTHIHTLVNSHCWMQTWILYLDVCSTFTSSDWNNRQIHPGMGKNNSIHQGRVFIWRYNICMLFCNCVLLFMHPFPYLQILMVENDEVNFKHFWKSNNSDSTNCIQYYASNNVYMALCRHKQSCKH